MSFSDVGRDSQGKGHIYSIPYAQYVQALYYRKDLFREAGLDPNKPPTNWDRVLRRLYKSLTDQDKDVWGFEVWLTAQVMPLIWWINFLVAIWWRNHQEERFARAVGSRF